MNSNAEEKMTREQFIMKYLGNSTINWSEEHCDMMRNDLDKVINYHDRQSEIDELTKEVERLRKENNSMLKEKMYFNRMKELVSKVAYDSEHYTQKTYEVLRNDAIGLLNEYNLTTH